MSNILVSGLLNIETSVKIREFPINYYPIDYHFFGISSCVSGVGYNIAKALKTLGDDITVFSIIGNDFEGEKVTKELAECGINSDYISKEMPETATSVILYDENGRRQIHCDLKDIQERSYNADLNAVENCDIAIICNINFNRNLLKKAKELNKIIATDVHVLNNIDDDYNRDFMEKADILFLSDENLPCEAKDFIMQIENKYHNKIIVLGQGSKGALMYVKDDDKFYDFSCVKNDDIVNTVGAGDALFSSFIHYYAKGMTPVESLKRAEIFASKKISANGASKGFITENEVEDIYSNIEITVS